MQYNKNELLSSNSHKKKYPKLIITLFRLIGRKLYPLKVITGNDVKIKDFEINLVNIFLAVNIHL